MQVSINLNRHKSKQKTKKLMRMFYGKIQSRETGKIIYKFMRFLFYEIRSFYVSH